MQTIKWHWLLIGVLFFGCKTTKETSIAQVNQNNIEEASKAVVEMQLTPDWIPKYYGYKPSHTRKNDLLHTRLDIRFDWKKRHVHGKAQLKFSPYFYPTQNLVLDAKGFDIHQLGIIDGETTKKLSYTYENDLLDIQLDRSYMRGESYEIVIDYTAKPSERASNTGGAITSEQGLYFIDPDSTDPNKPTQIWTQGEPQSSSCWFPTIDWPNERATQEIYLTVDSNYVSVSNGRLVESTDNGDGTRTDYWKQELPHAPYLTALVVGDFELIKDSWRGKEVNYYMEKEYAPYAQLIFGDTPEMMEYYSKVLGVDYPWDKYAQIVVRDFVSGAMENTGCVIFYDALNHDARQHLDETNEDIIAHELFHHWFGDLVTMESFANLPLNESFATYGEALWFRHKYGKDEADYHLAQDLDAYLGEAQTKREPLIRYEYKKPKDMFDAHSYQKGGRVLYMLHQLVGEEAFFASLNLYLTRNAYTEVEMHELRLAFEDVTGRDLNWFFDQWFFKPGHPELEVFYSIQKNESDQQLINIYVDQVQDLRYIPLYRLLVNIQITNAEGKVAIYPVEMTTRDSTFQIAYEGTVGNVIFDADRVLLSDMKEEKPFSYWLNQLKYGQNYKQKQEAMVEVASNIKNDEVIDALLVMLKDPFWASRLEAIEALSRYEEGARRKKIMREFIRLASEDPKSVVRKTALQYFSNEESIQYATERELLTSVDDMLRASLQDSSYSVQAAALQTLTYRSPLEAIKLSKEFAKAPAASLMGISTLILMQMNDPRDFETVINNLDRIPTSIEQAQIVQGFGPYLQGQSEINQKKGLEALKKVAQNSQVSWIRLFALQTMEDYSNQPDIQEFFKLRLEADDDHDVKAFCKDIVDGL